jgi:hypothetical protein
MLVIKGSHNSKGPDCQTAKKARATGKTEED